MVPSSSASMDRSLTHDAEDIAIVASGAALQQVSQWLGVSADEVLQEANAEVDKMFAAPHPQLLGLGAKYLSHKSTENSGVEMRLKRKLKQSDNHLEQLQYVPAQLHRGHKKQKHLASSAAAAEQAAQPASSDDDDGKLHSLVQHVSVNPTAKQSRLLERQQLLSVPVENLSKWQKKRLRQKQKKAGQSEH